MIAAALGISRCRRPPTPTASSRNVLRRFRRNRRGSAAVEFALVAPVFFALLFAIIETATRVLREPGAGDRHAGFRAHDHDRPGANRGLYRKLSSRPASAAQITRAVRLRQRHLCRRAELSRRSRSVIDQQIQIDASGNFIDNHAIQPRRPRRHRRRAAVLSWPLFVTGLGYNIANLAGSKRLLIADGRVPQRALSDEPAIMK